MTSEERSAVFAHAIVCSIYNDLNWLQSFCKGKDMKSISEKVYNVYLAVEDIHNELSSLVNKHTEWPEDKDDL